MSDEDDGEEITVESLRERIAALSERLDEAETEADLDEIEDDVEAVEADIEAADLPEPDDEDEDPPAEELESEVSDLTDEIEDERGPYAADVTDAIEEAKGTVADTRWTETGESEVLEAVEGFLATDGIEVEADLADLEDVGPAVDEAVAAVEAHDLDPDDDAETIADLLAATDDLADGIEAAESWDDLSVKDKLAAQGFYDVLDHRKDYPPEWHAIKIFEKRGDADAILTALDLLDSDFMERHCLEALERMGPEAALDPMLQRAQRRDKQAIRILGTIGDDEPVETLAEYVDADSDRPLQRVTFRALGEIGSEEATQAVADKLVADAEEVRSRAARTLGMIGDTRAIEPLADVLADDEETDTVRGSAAWALNQIGTERALAAVADYADDAAFLVQTEAEKARDATESPAA